MEIQSRLIPRGTSRNFICPVYPATNCSTGIHIWEFLTKMALVLQEEPRILGVIAQLGHKICGSGNMSFLGALNDLSVIDIYGTTGPL